MRWAGTTRRRLRRRRRRGDYADLRRLAGSLLIVTRYSGRQGLPIVRNTAFIGRTSGSIQYNSTTARCGHPPSPCFGRRCRTTLPMAHGIPGTRHASLNTENISFEAHQAWVRSVLADPARRLYVAERQGIPVGTLRVDRRDDACELSWTVAPEFRGRGIGTRMVMMVAASTRGARSRPESELTTSPPSGLRRRLECGWTARRMACCTSCALTGEATAYMTTNQAVSTPRRERLAIDGGAPVRTGMLRYAGQAVDESDIHAVEAVLRGEWLTTGPAVREFEANLCAERTGARFAVAVNTGTAALHLAAAAAASRRTTK